MGIQENEQVYTPVNTITVSTTDLGTVTIPLTNRPQYNSRRRERRVFDYDEWKEADEVEQDLLDMWLNDEGYEEEEDEFERYGGIEFKTFEDKGDEEPEVEQEVEQEEKKYEPGLEPPVLRRQTNGLDLPVLRRQTNDLCWVETNVKVSENGSVEVVLDVKQRP